MKTSLKLTVAAAAMMAMGGFLAPAHADKIKDCGTTTTTTSTGRDHQTVTTTTTETQIAQCDSASDTGEVITTDTGPVTNNGGGTPPGQQP